MTLIRKTIYTDAKIGDIIKAPNGIFRDDLELYICHIDGNLLYISTDKNALKNECETAFAEDCYLI